VGAELGRSRHARGVAIIGLAKPWGHWTVLRRVLPNRAFFFDSWGFPKTTDFNFFTFDEDRAGEGRRQKTLLVYHQTFFLSLEPGTKVTPQVAVKRSLK
jgi:hypothetical protein